MILVLGAFILILVIAVLLKKPKPRFISVAMIVKNEENFLRDCLESLKLIPNKEIIIVDTGSTDKTKKIALEYTDKVFDYVWDNNFAKARNYGIDKCKGDYIFIIDADEIVKKWDDPKGEYSMVQVNNKNGSVNTPHWSVRIIKNNRGYRYSYRVHEKLEPSLAGQYAFVNYSIIEHHGYEQTIEEKKERTKKMLEIHLKQLEEEPTNAAVFYHIALCLHALQSWIEARDFTALALHSNVNEQVKAYLCINMFQCLRETGQEDIGGYWLELSLKYCAKQIYARLLLAEYLSKRGGKEEAIKQLNFIRETIKKQESMLPNDLLITEEQLQTIERNYCNAI